LPGIDRPAICAQLPATTGHVHMLDLGANVESSAEQLQQFAIMGSVLASVVDNIKRPRIGLLNIGAEEIKGNDGVKQASKLLSQTDINYIGFVEGDDIFKGTADVVVCDGFIGNIALKSCEGVAQMMGQFLREEFSRNILTRLAGLVAMPILRTLKPRMDPREYNGATFVGLRGIVIKSHGGADHKAFLNAIEVARTEIEQQLPECISASMTPIFEAKEAV
jgi:glycerol-3-phosphate acyltransferase PlsX